MLDERERIGNRLLVQIGHLAQKPGRARLRRFRIYRQRSGNLRTAVLLQPELALGIVLREAVERAVEAEIVDGVAKGEVGKTFRRKSGVPGHERPGQFRFRERLAHEIFCRQRQRELRVAQRRGRCRNGNFKRVRFVLLHLERTPAAQPLPFFADGADAILSERSVW